jgi:O-methyltransferase
MKQTLKRILYPVRKLAARFVNINENYQNTIIYKAANIIVAEKVEGDYLEFGVYEGRSFIHSYHVIESVIKQHQKLSAGRTEDVEEIKGIWENMRFFAFDSFQGLPALSGVDKEGRDFAKGRYECTENAFRDNLVKANVPLSKMVMVAGWFENTCTEGTIRKYGFGFRKAFIN